MIKTFIISALALVPAVSQAQHIFDLPDACTYYGNASDDFARALAVDASGNVFITGNTNSLDLPGTDSSNGTWDVFIAKFDASLENLLAATLIGGSGTDIVYDLAIDSSGSIVICGSTNSVDFPTTFGAYKTSLTSPDEAFVTILNNTLTAVIASTLVSPTINDNAYGKVGLAIDAAQNIYIAASAEDSASNTGADAVISKLSSSLSTLLASTVLGDSANDYAMALAVDNGNVFVGGRSASVGFPSTTTDTLSGAADGFITILSDDLQLIDASRLFGGVKSDEVTALAPDGTGGVYAAGNTFSDTLFSSGFQHSLAGSQDGFVIHLTSALSVVARTYIGGLSTDAVDAMILGDDGLLYLCGQTNSSDFPKTWQGFDQVFVSGEGFVSALSHDLTSMVAGGFLGGNFSERVYDITQDGASIYFTGWTQSDTFWQTPTAFDTMWNGGADAFVLSCGSLASLITKPLEHDAFVQLREHTLYLELEVASVVAFDIFSADGRLVYSQSASQLGSGFHETQLPEIQPAAYFIRVRIGHDEQMLKYLR